MSELKCVHGHRLAYPQDGSCAECAKGHYPARWSRCDKCGGDVIVEGDDLTIYCIDCARRNTDMTLVANAFGVFAAAFDAWRRERIGKAAYELLTGPRRCTDNRHDPSEGPVLVTITYFKPTSGKWYCDEDVEWKPDPSHFTRWQDFRELHRLKNMTAVCMVTPLGFPQSSPGDLSKWDDHRRTEAQACGRMIETDDGSMGPRCILDDPHHGHPILTVILAAIVFGSLAEAFRR